MEDHSEFGILLYSFDISEDPTQPLIRTPTLIATFLLPTLTPRAFTSNRFLRLFTIPCSGTYPSANNTRPFEASVNNQLHLVQVVFLDYAAYFLVVQASAFQLLPAEPVVIPWEVWGPEHSRWISDPKHHEVGSFENADRRGYGSSLLTSTHVLDFNPLEVERDISRNNKASAGGRITLDSERMLLLVGRQSPTVIHAGEIFKEDFRSRLPFRSLKHRIPLVHYWLVNPGEDWILRVFPQ